MVTSEREIMEFIEEYDVKFIRLAFLDVYKRQWQWRSVQILLLFRAITAGMRN